MSGVKRSTFDGLGERTPEVPALWCSSAPVGGVARLEERGLGVMISSESEPEESVVERTREGGEAGGLEDVDLGDRR